jgi:murein DD-endopeptidase MepM/ murein hydrolase activator NlpD
LKSRVGFSLLAVAAGSWLTVVNATPFSATANPSERRAALRSELTKVWDAQAQALDRTSATVTSKVHIAIAQRERRARAAALILSTHLSSENVDPLALARRRAAAKFVLAKERSEVMLLTEERDQLAMASDAIAAAAAQVVAVELPPSDLRWPAEGEVTRGFGNFVHVRSKATLSRRGIDLEVDEHSQAHCAAAGKVIYSGPIRGLDNGIIVDHGWYLTVIAKLGKLTRVAGAALEANDTVGRAAGSRLYFELRVKAGPEGTPVDPQLFLRRR